MADREKVAGQVTEKFSRRKDCIGRRGFAFLVVVVALFAGGRRSVASMADTEVDPPVSAAIAKNRVPPVFEGRLSSEFETAYLSTSGTLCDTRPTSLQNLDWTVHLGDYGKLYGYGAFLSMLHDKQHELHRPAFNEFEGGAFYGYGWKLSETVTFFNGAGGVWNPLFGYRNGYDDTLWEFRYFQSLENPYLTPYWDTLTLIEPGQWTRVRFGVRRDFALTETLKLSAWVDGVWGDKRRFKARYGDEPDHRFLDGAFCTTTVGLQLTWRFSEHWMVYAKIRQLDTINARARRAEKRKNVYWARRDIAIGTLGVAYDF